MITHLMFETTFKTRRFHFYGAQTLGVGQTIYQAAIMPMGFSWLTGPTVLHVRSVFLQKRGQNSGGYFR